MPRLKIPTWLRVLCMLLVRCGQAHPVESLLSAFLAFCILWPGIAYPTRFGYSYPSLTQMKKDLVPCNKTSATGEMAYDPKLPDCPLYPDVTDDLAFDVKTLELADEVDLEQLAKRLGIKPGGRWKPSHCNPQHRVAIVVPYRNRERQLKVFVQHMHLFLQKQLLDYGLFIVEQSQRHEFNRAKLFNIGYAEALKQHDYCCFIFHDVDLLPENPRNLYACSKNPRHMSASLDIFRYVLPYAGLFGGVISVSRSQFEAVNGFSNEYFGWGGEDDDFYTRLRLANIKTVRWNPQISRYTMLQHEKAAPNPNRFQLLYSGWERHEADGISNLQYKVLNFVQKPLYTWIQVDLKPD